MAKKKKGAASAPLPPTDYYLFDCYPDVGDALISVYPDLPAPHDNWLKGKRWEADAIPQPLQFFIEEEHEGTLLPLYTRTIPLMRRDLLEALREAGVDNLDAYEAVITERRSGTVHTNYCAVNIVGTIAAADMADSDAKAMPFDNQPMIDTFFRKLVVDKEATHGQLMFRLAEKVTKILVHTSVCDHLKAQGFERLNITHPSA